MTRFVYIADTHLGAQGPGYQMQQRYPEHLADILAALEQWLVADGDIDFVLHGGDMVDRGDGESIRAAVDLFHLSVPVYLCLGNHDLSEAGSKERWLTLAPGFFGGESGGPAADGAVESGGRAHGSTSQGSRLTPGQGGPAVDYAIQTKDCVVQVMPNQWGKTPYRWEDEQQPHFLERQLRALEARLAPDTATRVTAAEDGSPAPGDGPGRSAAAAAGVQLLLTHSPARDVPAAQRGDDRPFHAPPAGFSADIAHLCATHAGIRCLLGAHSHVNMCVEDAGVQHITVSSLVETPFEYKLFEIDARGVAMRTLSLLPQVDFPAVYDFDRTFVQGRACDRMLERRRG